MDIFIKGDFRPVPKNFRMLGVNALDELTNFQERFSIFDTDTTVNSIRDAIVANYLGFDLLNFDKHGFDAKKSLKDQYLEVKQCSISSRRLGGTWNDTSEDKARAFSDKRLFTVVAVWKGASDLQCLVYGQHAGLGEYLLKRVVGRRSGSRSTQSVGIDLLIKSFGFTVIAPPGKTKMFVEKMLVNYQRSLSEYVTSNKIKTIRDLQ